MTNETSGMLMKGGSLALIPICLYLLGWVNLGEVLEAEECIKFVSREKKDSLLTENWHVIPVQGAMLIFSVLFQFE